MAENNYVSANNGNKGNSVQMKTTRISARHCPMEVDGDAAREITMNLPAPISCGRRGMKINLETNFFAVQATKDDVRIACYEVEFLSFGNQATLPHRHKSGVFELMRRTHPKVFAKHLVAFDKDKKAYSVGILPDVANSTEHSASYEVSKVNENCDKKCKVTLTLREELPLNKLREALYGTQGQQNKYSQKLIQALEVMFRHSCASKYKLIGRRHFFVADGKFRTTYPIGYNKEAVLGFFSSMRPSSWRHGSLAFNIDVALSPFYKEQTLLDFVNGVIKLDKSDLSRTLNPHRKDRLRREMQDLKVMVDYNSVPQMHKIIAVTEQGANTQTFPYKDAKTGMSRSVTVVDYFKFVLGKTLYFPNFNCVQVAPAEKKIFLPMEYCRVASAQKVRRMTEQEVTQLLRTAAIAPTERRKLICEIYAKNKFSEDPMLKELGFYINENLMNVSGRVLSPPKLYMNRVVEARNGLWDSRGYQFFQGASIRSWAVMNYIPDDINNTHIRPFVNQLMKLANGFGMEFSGPTAVQAMPRTHVKENFVDFQRRHQHLQLILIILGRNDELYGSLKRVGDMDVGMMTQCVQASTVQLCKASTIIDLVLKINAKMGGIGTIIANPSTPPIFSHSVMIMGADVNHPPAGDSVSPSMAAVVASTDRHASMYNVEVAPQEHRVEIIRDLRRMVKNLILGYKKVHNRWPSKIVMYRDGVSETEFIAVLLSEVKAIRQACADLEITPGLTFLIVQKRHHTRFFCRDTRDTRRYKNVPPGTVVDSGITHPSERGFFLCSHQGIQGTVRPTHYHVLWDDNDMTMDELEALTYSLCHLYSRCTKSVSLPTPAYYAHLAAFRAKVHMGDLFDHCDCQESVTKEDIIKAAQMDSCNPMASRMYYI